MLPPRLNRRLRPRARKPLPELNLVQLHGRVDDVQQRWTPDGGIAVNALLIVPRTAVASEKRVGECEQPLPLRAIGEQARMLLDSSGKNVEIRGHVRRRLYQRQQQTHWGQVEIWVTDCRPVHQEVLE